MKDLQNVFNERLGEYLASSAIQDKIDNAIDKCFTDCIDSAFRYGDIKKTIEKAINEKMGVSMQSIDIQSYSEVISLILNKKMADFAGDASAEILTKMIDGVLSTAPKSVDMDDLAEKILTHYREENDDMSDHGEYYLVEMMGNDYGSYSFKIKDDDSFGSTKCHLLLMESHDKSHFYVGINHEMDITNPT